MQHAVRGTSRRCGGGFAKLVARNVEKGEAPTLLRNHLGIRLHLDFDPFFARMNVDANRPVAKFDLANDRGRGLASVPDDHGVAIS
jgi:hypothetical protein